MNEQIGQSEQLFDKKFNRLGGVLNIVENQSRIEDFRIFNLETNDIPKADAIVRQVESEFAEIYDDVQFTTPGMKNMAETDTKLFESWVGNVDGKKILEIGPGTGRLTLPLAEAVGSRGKIYLIETAEPYLEKLISKAVRTGMNPERMKLGVGDMQSLSIDTLNEFTEGKLDYIVMWFGPFALMPTAPKEVLEKCAQLLKPGGELLLTTNSLNGLSYRIPEAFLRQGADPDLPLGYKPSIATRRSFPNEDAERPTGMILTDGSVLPAIFYDPSELVSMISQAGLEIQDVRGITRLTGFFPANPEDANAIQAYIDIVNQIDANAGSLMKRDASSQNVWQIAKTFDQLSARDPAVISQYNYPAVRAVKKEN